MAQKTISFSDLFAPVYYKCWNDIIDRKYHEFWFKGGRGSCKSSFISIVIVLGIMQDRDANGVVFRKVGSDIRDSVFEQILWAIDALGVGHLWEANKSLLRFKYAPTGQVILCRGLDDPTKVKSIKVRKGYFKYIWYEELAQFANMEEIRNTGQSLRRGGKEFLTFCSYNPPRSQSAWVNAEASIPMENRVVYHTTYLDIPKDWLGPQFFSDAEALKIANPVAYEHEYLGKVTGTGGTVFANLELREIPDEELSHFDNYKYGIDWGYKDPCVFIACHYDRKHDTIYVIDEIYRTHLQKRRFGELVLEKETGYEFVWCDSSEPASIDELSTMGINCQPAKKGKDSIRNGIIWLQNRFKIVIDPIRCPNAAREFEQFEYKRDRSGEWTDNFSEKFNHTVDAVRYAMEEDSIQGGIF
jgi:PBSX family phage terminase large subunit